MCKCLFRALLATSLSGKIFKALLATSLSRKLLKALLATYLHTDLNFSAKT